MTRQEVDDEVLAHLPSKESNEAGDPKNPDKRFAYSSASTEGSCSLAVRIPDTERKSMVTP